MNNRRLAGALVLTTVVAGLACAKGVVAPTPPSSVEIALGASSLAVGRTLTAIATVRDASGLVTDGHTISWASNHTELASITDGGVVTGIAPGAVQITASTEGISATAPLTIVPAPVARVDVSLAANSLNVGQSTQATATPRDAGGNPLAGRAVAWSSSNTAVATVNASGVVNAIGAGSANITATSEGINGSAAVTVSTVVQPVATVAVTLGATTLVAGGSTQASVTLRDANGSVLTGRTVSWASSNNGVATVSQNGVVTAVAAGSASITATSEGKSGSASVTITAISVASVSVALGSGTIGVGGTTTAAATTRDASNNVLTGRAIAWSSSNTAVATVNAAGLVSGIAAGSANIVATSEGVTGQASITVTAPPPPAPVATVSVTLATASLAPGATTQATVTLRDASSNVLTGRTISWSSSNTGVATVSQSGVVAAVAAGSANIVATSEGVTGQASVSVTAPPPPAPVATVSVVLAAPSLAPGGSTQASVTLRDASNNVLTGRTISWSSSNTGVATVSSTGAVAAVANGTASIIATSEGKTGSAMLTVATATPGSNEPAGAVVITERGFNNTIEDGWTLPSFAVPYLTIVQDGAAPKSPSNVAQIRYPAGFGGGDSPALAERDLTSGRATTLYVSMWLKLSSNWSGHPTGTNKVMHFWINGGNRVFAFADGSGNNVLTPRIGLQAISGAYNDGFGTTSTTVELRPNVSGQTGAQIVRGRWQRWEIAMTSNTNGDANGTLDWWIDGTHVGHYTGIAYVPAGASRTWDIVKWDPTWGGQGSSIPADQFMYMDHLYMSGKP